MAISHVATFLSGCCISKSIVVLPSTLDYFKGRDEALTRLKFFDFEDGFDGQSDCPGWIGVNVCLFENGRRAFLDEEGRVLFFDKDPANDVELKITDAGVFSKGAKGYGYVTKIRTIGSGLYVCGDSRQVYRYAPPGPGSKAGKKGKFVHFDAGMLQSPMPDPPAETGHVRRDEAAYQEWLDKDESAAFWDIGGPDESDIYAVGAQTWHFDGQQWRQLKLPTDEVMLVILVISKDEIVIGGRNGSLLRGNARTGFRDVSRVEDNQTITGLAVFEGRLFIASNLGLFVWDLDEGKIQPYKTDLQPELTDAHELEAKDGVLWSFGFKDLAWFDGKKWTRIQHPDNPPIV